MGKGLWFSGGIIGLCALTLTFSTCTDKNASQSQVERGRYLVMAGGCNDCHTPKIFTAKGPVFRQ